MESIKASEVRIGNWIWGVSDRIEVISEIRRDVIETVFRGYLYNYCTIDDISPIELTPEILLKAGFEKLNKQNYNNSDTWAISIEMPHSLYDFIFELETSPDRSNYFYKTSNPIKYLHQLQNLYHALTSQELTINL